MSLMVLFLFMCKCIHHHLRILHLLLFVDARWTEQTTLIQSAVGFQLKSRKHTGILHCPDRNLANTNKTNIGLVILYWPRKRINIVGAILLCYARQLPMVVN